MKLSRLYSNRPDIFGPVDFTPGLNVVHAEIRLPENRKKDTHNLGKTTFGRVIDFCLLAGRDPRSFLYKHADLFPGIEFFLEIALLSDSFVTVRRGVDQPTKISFKYHKRGSQDFTGLPLASWDHAEIAFEKSVELLDGVLDLRDLKPWKYRKLVGYLIRSQDDFRDVFQLGKFKGKYSDWKPFLAHILGFDAALLEKLYAKEEELKSKKDHAAVLERDLGDGVTDLSKVDGLLLLKRDEAEKKQRLLDAFDFRKVDKDKTAQVVDELDAAISALNKERYSLSVNRKKIASSLEDDEIAFDAATAEKLFKEAGVLFSGQIKKDFESLISFNKAITEERSGYLREELAEVEVELKRVNAELQAFNRRRNETLAFLSGADVFVKFRQVSDELVAVRADIVSLERQREHLQKLHNLRAAIRALLEEQGHLQTQIEKDVIKQNADQTSRFTAVRRFFSEIVEAVIDRKALLIVAPNKEGHLDFKVEVLDEAGNPTLAGQGFTYRKLLCVAFDLAVARAHFPGRYPRFVFHDGVLESLDDRKKRNILEVMREYSSFGLQHIITVIDSDVPPFQEGQGAFFSEDEIILRLHDEDESGRLFKMRSW